MDDNLLDSIDGYCAILDAYFKTMSPMQRTAFAAGLAERLFGVYLEFSIDNGWGEPVSFREMLDAVWDHVQGKPLTADQMEEFRERCQSIAPSMDDFDAYDALMACQTLAMAVECCEGDADPHFAKTAAISGYDATVDQDGTNVNDPETDRRIWRQPAVQREIAGQFELLRQVIHLKNMDPVAGVVALKRLHGGKGPAR